MFLDGAVEFLRDLHMLTLCDRSDFITMKCPLRAVRLLLELFLTFASERKLISKKGNCD